VRVAPPARPAPRGAQTPQPRRNSPNPRRGRWAGWVRLSRGQCWAARPVDAALPPGGENVEIAGWRWQHGIAPCDTPTTHALFLHYSSPPHRPRPNWAVRRSVAAAARRVTAATATAAMAAAPRVPAQWGESGSIRRSLKGLGVSSRGEPRPASRDGVRRIGTFSISCVAFRADRVWFAMPTPPASSVSAASGCEAASSRSSSNR
jgi:hypothetical protein